MLIYISHTPIWPERHLQLYRDGLKIYHSLEYFRKNCLANDITVRQASGMRMLYYELEILDNILWQMF